jgi:2,4-dienoyl-CoA reductase-like NADH-dependent reductase (Old Yellow Enzyme family)
LIDNYVRAARLAKRVGFGFVDVKHCHGYLGHEFLSAFTRKGRFGGDFDGRTRFAREIIGRIQSDVPGLIIGVRLSAFDHPPFKPDPNLSKDGRPGPGIPDDYQRHLPYVYAFGCNPDNPLEIDLAEPIRFISMLAGMGAKLINVSGCSPYYNPHFQRPAAFPPSDGYQPPEDPLAGVNRQIQVTRELKAACPGSILVGTGYSYLQEYLPHVAQAVLRQGWADSIGVGRLVLSYWDMLADTLEATPLRSKRICRTFSDCTTAPRNGIISGCFPLDPNYKDAPEHAQLKAAKANLRRRPGTA